MKIHGTCDPRFVDVSKAFTINFKEDGDVGAAVCVTLNGEIVVDLWGGHATPDRTIPWDRDTIVNTFSATKAMTALCAHLLIDSKLLDVDAPVANYWPEFAAEGKESLPVRYILDHRSGLPWVSPGKDGYRLLEWDETCRRLAARAPLYPPGSRVVYHALSFGFLVGELVRRITGQSLGQFFAREVAKPLGVDFYIGVPADQPNTIAQVIPPMINGVSQLPLPGIEGGAELINSSHWRAAEIPAVNGHGHARALATVMGALANGGRWDDVQLVNTESIEVMWQRSEGNGGGPHDSAWALGFMPNWNNQWGPSRSAFGHTGFGGCVCFADPESRIGFAYVTNTMKMDEGKGDARTESLARSLFNH